MFVFVSVICSLIKGKWSRNSIVFEWHRVGVSRPILCLSVGGKDIYKWLSYRIHNGIIIMAEHLTVRFNNFVFDCMIFPHSQGLLQVNILSYEYNSHNVQYINLHLFACHFFYSIYCLYQLYFQTLIKNLYSHCCFDCLAAGHVKFLILT